MTNGSSYIGTILARDVDPWTFTACAGNTITLQATAISNSPSLTPWLRLFGPHGTLLSGISSSPTATISGLVTETGTYTLWLADGGVSRGGTGTYRLTANGIFGPVTLDAPLISGSNLTLAGSGRGTNCTCVMLATTNIATPLTLWTPILTNHFGTTGQFTFTNAVDPSIPDRYFRLAVP